MKPTNDKEPSDSDRRNYGRCFGCIEKLFEEMSSSFDELFDFIDCDNNGSKKFNGLFFQIQIK